MGEREKSGISLAAVAGSCSQNPLQLGRVFPNEKGRCHGYINIKTSKTTVLDLERVRETERERERESERERVRERERAMKSLNNNDN